MSGTEYDPPVDEPPGKDGTQAPNPPGTPPVPEWGPGENPPGTNPPIPTPDTATTPIPGSIPGVVVGETPPVPPEPPAEPPVNVDVPHVSQTGVTLTCTMGNWDGEPTAYSYVWYLDGAEVSGGEPDYITTPEDWGKAATCVVTATNAAGSTTAPPSNEVTITE